MGDYIERMEKLQKNNFKKVRIQITKDFGVDGTVWPKHGINFHKGEILSVEKRSPADYWYVADNKEVKMNNFCITEIRSK